MNRPIFLRFGQALAGSSLRNSVAFVAALCVVGACLTWQGRARAAPCGPNEIFVGNRCVPRPHPPGFGASWGHWGHQAFGHRENFPVEPALRPAPPVVVIAPASAKPAANVPGPPPPVVVNSPPPAAPPAPPPPNGARRIIDSGYAPLTGAGKETPGYGLYTYVLLRPVSPERATAMFAALIALNAKVSDLKSNKREINVIYVPALAAQEAGLRTRDMTVVDYDFGLAATLLDEICEASSSDTRSNADRICAGGLDAGPYLFSYATPVGGQGSLAPPILFVDLSRINVGAFPTFVDAYRTQVKQSDIDDRRKIDSLSLRVLNIALTAADWLTPVQGALASIVHTIEPANDGGKP